MQPVPWIRGAFYAAAAMNFSIIAFSRAFSNPLMGQVDPLFAPEGCLLVCIWGLCYAAVADHHHRVPNLALVFCIEKFFYVVAWLGTMVELGGDYSSLYAQDPLTGIFFTVYGAGDALVGIFFAYVWWRFRGGKVET